jgi:serine/threonine-protein kinase
VVVVEGTPVRINVSRGPKPVTVPNVIGLPYEQAASELQRVGFGVARVDVDSELAKGIVVDQDPNGGSSSSKGSTITLSVSRGPVTSSVPDVTTQDVSIATTTLEAAGFRTREVLEDTDDPTLDGVVISQDPVGGAQAKPNSIVTLFVGRFVDPSTETTPFP